MIPDFTFHNELLSREQLFSEKNTKVFLKKYSIHPIHVLRSIWICLKGNEGKYPLNKSGFINLEEKMTRKILDPEKYGVAICPSCDTLGFIQNPKRQCCPKCGGFGYIIGEPGQDTDTSNKVMSPSVIRRET